MRNRQKKLISLLICFAFLMMLVPISMAAETTTIEKVIYTEPNVPVTLADGTNVTPTQVGVLKRTVTVSDVTYNYTIYSGIYTEYVKDEMNHTNTTYDYGDEDVTNDFNTITANTPANFRDITVVTSNSVPSVLRINTENSDNYLSVGPEKTNGNAVRWRVGRNDWTDVSYKVSMKVRVSYASNVTDATNAGKIALYNANDGYLGAIAFRMYSSNMNNSRIRLYPASGNYVKDTLIDVSDKGGGKYGTDWIDLDIYASSSQYSVYINGEYGGTVENESGKWTNCFKVAVYKDSATTADCVVDYDDLTVYRYEYVSELQSNTNTANAVVQLITANAITGGNTYSVTSDLSLNAPFDSVDLEGMGVSVNWTSSDTSVITNDGKVTQADTNRYVTMTAAITAGSGDNAVTVNKSVGVVVGNTTKIDTYCYDFEDGSANWTVNTNATTIAENHSERDSKVLQTVFSGEGSVYTVASNHSIDNTKTYFIGADVCFEPDAETTKSYFVVKASSAELARIGFVFGKGGVSLSDDDMDKEYKVRNNTITPGEWYHIDLEYNAAQKNLMAYINGVAITENEIDIPTALWDKALSIEQLGLYSNGTGKGYIDNVTAYVSRTNAPVYDANNDYTIRSIALTNGDNKTITNVKSTATTVRAQVKVIQNRIPQNGEAKILFARYDTSGNMQQVVSKKIETTANGQIVKLPMPLTGDCSEDIFKIFVLDADTITPICENLNSTAPKFDVERILAKAPNAVLASELGYDITTPYENIYAIAYDGDTYRGNPVKHFAYIGLPEGASAENPVPAMVCVHGGGGSASYEWVKQWNDRGYAAISIDCNGRVPQSGQHRDDLLCHAWAGATLDNYKAVSPDDTTWMYGAVTAVTGAHNVLRAMDEIDNSKIGIIGGSWGGIVTSTAIGVDNRFVFAIPVWGCAYLLDSETYMGGLMTEDRKLWEPSEFLKNADMPVLWVNGDTDYNFSLTSTSKSAELTGDDTYVSIIPGYGHYLDLLWQTPSIFAFADSMVKDGTPLIRGQVAVNGSTATATTDRAAVSATMYYTTAEEFTYNSSTGKANFSFTTVTTDAENTTSFTFEIPSDATKLYVVFTDADGNSTSTTLVDVE